LASLKYTDDPTKFAVYLLIGRGINKEHANLKTTPTAPDVHCDSTSIDFTQERNVVCTRKHETETVLITIQFKSGPSALLTMPAVAGPVKSLGIAEKIAAGHHFAVSFGAIPGGHLGTIYQFTSLHGVYVQARQGWQVWGPNGPKGLFADVEYCVQGLPGCQPNGNCATGQVCRVYANSTQPGDPTKKVLDLWSTGASAVTFDDQGNVYLNSTKVGVVTVDP
jgi:hypothetical protein